MPTKWFLREKQQRQKCIDHGLCHGCTFFVSRTTLCNQCAKNRCQRHNTKTTYHKERGYKNVEEYKNTDYEENGTDFEIIYGQSRLLMDLNLPWSDEESILNRTVDLILKKLQRNGMTNAHVLWIGTSHKEMIKKSYLPL